MVATAVTCGWKSGRVYLAVEAVGRKEAGGWVGHHFKKKGGGLPISPSNGSAVSWLTAPYSTPLQRSLHKE